MSNLSGQIAVITGASSGIGRAVALRLAQEEMVLCLIGRNPKSLESVVREVEKSSPRVLPYIADFTNDRDLEELARNIKKDLPHINVLVHCAGVLKMGRVEDSALTDFDLQYQTNIRAPFSLTRNLVPMIRQCAGQVVVMNSSIWQHARAGLSQYAATKYALKAFTDSLRDELNPHGVRVLSMYLGRTATPMQAALHEQENLPYHPDFLIQPEDIASILVHILSLPYTSEVTDIHIRPMKKPPL